MMSENLLSKRIRELRRSAGMTQTELARELKCNPSSICLYECGKILPGMKKVAKIAEILKDDGVLLVLAKDELRRRLM